MTCEQWSVVVVPFPFTDRPTHKRRPALVVSNGLFNQNGHTMLAMITSASGGAWPGDTRIGDHEAAGLHLPCLVRLKLFTLDNRLILRAIGKLARGDRRAVERGARAHLL